MYVLVVGPSFIVRALLSIFLSPFTFMLPLLINLPFPPNQIQFSKYVLDEA